MKNLLLALLACAVISPALLHAGPGRAHACSCLVQDTEDSIRRTFEFSDAVVVGTVSERRAGDPETVLFDVERQYHGENRGQFVVRYSYGEHSQCPGYTVTEGTRHLLWLQHREPQVRTGYELQVYGLGEAGDPDGVYTPMGCFTSQLASSTNARDQIAIMERMTTPWSPVRGAAWVPWAFTAGVLAAIALAVLVMMRAERRTTKS